MSPRRAAELPQQISHRVPPETYKTLRRLSYELHRSQTRIIIESVKVYDELVTRAKRDRLAREKAASGEPEGHDG